jgi:PAS domain S-box-containing protein
MKSVRKNKIKTTPAARKKSQKKRQAVKTLKSTGEDLLESKKKLHALTTSNADLVWEANINEKDLHWFGDIDGILGYEKGEFERTIVGHMESIHPDDHDHFITTVEKALNSGEDLYVSYRIRCKDGTYRHWEEYGKAIGFENGKPVKWVGTITDITGRKQAEETLANNKKRFLAMLEKFKSSAKLEHADAFSSILTQDKMMRAIFHYIEIIAESSEPILIMGETGVGKELISEAIYNISNVKGKFVAVNVAGLDDTMFSDTLFGHKKGAYTGADKDREGLIVKASGGTLLLDEIGDLSDLSQIKLLRLIEDGTYYPLGSDKRGKSNARIIASTNRDVNKLVANGKFREDFYYRLCSIQIHIPPLRDRLEDIPLLVDHFLDISASSLNKKKPTAPEELISLLSSYCLPGNIRELKAMIFDAVAKHRSGMLSLKSFKDYINKKNEYFDSVISFNTNGEPEMPCITGRFPTLKEMNDFLVSEALKRSNGNQGIAASMLGITRQALNSRLKKTKEQP